MSLLVIETLPDAGISAPLLSLLGITNSFANYQCSRLQEGPIAARLPPMTLGPTSLIYVCITLNFMFIYPDLFMYGAGEQFWGLWESSLTACHSLHISPDGYKKKRKEKKESTEKTLQET